MTEENQVTKEPQQVQQDPQRVTTKNPKKVEAAKRLAAHNRKKREERRKEQVKLKKTGSGVNHYYHSLSRPNVCLAQLQMELCQAANIFAAH